ncbi:GXWXG domain-containing protein [Rubellimicrobium roseum]|uniref:DUF4334 domain-containing protein n=1 Tax=Rubellimicrobium roseum TaxID=687525 RepID=A0A5C4N401_9RHOB|nr:GXWXG domain-containing protein [Rubellimicrobium roseum]TNC61517.1 DUF4334 domain-containing protein [Rubellimicrobium roseum]
MNLPEPAWLASWAAAPPDTGAALERFDSLASVAPDHMAGLWRGRSLPTGHPLDGLLEALGWYGKAIQPDGRAHPLLFRTPSGAIASLDPAWMPTALALRWPSAARSALVRSAFRTLGPALRAQGPAAGLDLREFRGRRGLALVYDRQPIVDHLGRIDPDRVMGVMTRTGMARPFLFLLTREVSFSGHSPLGPSPAHRREPTDSGPSA